MSYHIAVDEVSQVVSITWSGVLDFSVLKRYVLSYNYHISHTDHCLMHDFRKVSDITLDENELIQVAELSRQVFDPLLKNIKVAMLTNCPEVTELIKLFTTIRTGRSDNAPQFGFFEDNGQAMSWIRDAG